jgi:hypothetical protein
MAAIALSDVTVGVGEAGMVPGSFPSAARPGEAIVVESLALPAGVVRGAAMELTGGTVSPVVSTSLLSQAMRTTLNNMGATLMVSRSLQELNVQDNLQYTP